MIDIVERLLSAHGALTGTNGHAFVPGVVAQTAKDAADELERLRAIVEPCCDEIEQADHEAMSREGPMQSTAYVLGPDGVQKILSRLWSYREAADDGSTLAQCKCGTWSRGGRACLACCDRMAEELSKKGYDHFPATRDETETR